MDKDKANDLLNTRWPGRESVMMSLVIELEAQLKEPWQMATFKARGPAKFKEFMADKLKGELIKLDHAILADVAAQALTPLIYHSLARVGKEITEKGEDPCK